MGDVAGESVILVRAAEALHAFYNVCQHRGAELRPVGGEVDVVTNDGSCTASGWTTRASRDSPSSSGSFKASEDCGGPLVDPDTRTFDADPAMESRLRVFVDDLIGDRRPVPRSTTCLYTLTADRDFVLDRLPDLPQIVVALGAAHAFKFAAWFGSELAALAMGGVAGPELAPFSITRQALGKPADRAAWLVRLECLLPLECHVLTRPARNTPKQQTLQL